MGDPIFDPFLLGKLFKQLHVFGSLRIGNIAKEQKIVTPEIPESIAGSWRIVNTPEELDK